MKFIGLISGGKDSIFNCLLCLQQGHELIALANLKAPSGIQELDSFMYQTVGNDLIQGYSECFAGASVPLPLFQREIRGIPLQVQRNSYQPQGGEQKDEDEVEDMYLLLSQVLLKHPEAQAVAVGAILSNYQRLRVENVCSRLGLVVLAGLWQQNQSFLLNCMVRSGIQAVVVKVAAMGLGVEMLGKEIGKLQETFERLSQTYGVNVCGEGGEYETMVLDCPGFVKRIVLDEVEKVVVEQSDWAPVAHLKIKRWHLEAKDRRLNAICSKEANEKRLDSICSEEETSYLATSNSICFPIVRELPELVVEFHDHCNCQIIHNPLDDLIDAFPFANHFDNQWKPLDHSLETTSNTKEIAFVMVLLPDMQKYREFNGEYSRYFSSIVDPPARACIQVNGISNPMIKMMRFPCVSGHLHVQSISYWAPANIGPYSQVVEAGEGEGGEFVIFSGILGFVPETMVLAEGADEQLRWIIRHIEALNLKRVALNFFVVFYLKESVDAEERKLGKWQANLRKIFGREVEVIFVPVDGLPRGAFVEVVCAAGAIGK